MQERGSSARCSAGNSASPIETIGGAGGFAASRGLSDGFGGTVTVWTARINALNASSRPAAGNPKNVSSDAAVAPIAPTRAIANAVAIDTGDATQFLPDEVARHMACAKAAIPAVIASTGAPFCGTSHATSFAVSSPGTWLDDDPQAASGAAASAARPASSVRRET